MDGVFAPFGVGVRGKPGTGAGYVPEFSAVEETTSGRGAALAAGDLLALAADLSGRPGYFDALRVHADTQISLGPATGEEVRTVILAYERGLLSRAAGRASAQSPI